MPRSSRHRSQRSPKRSSEHSDSLEGESLRERKTRDEETLGTSGLRVSRDLEPEKRRSVHEHAGKEILNSSNGDPSSEKKRKTRGNEEMVVADRWHGGKENDEKRSTGEDFGQLVLDKSSKVKTIDSKNRSSRRYDGAYERDEDRGGRNDSTKAKPERVSSQREVTYHYKDGKEKEINNDQEVQDSRHEKSEDLYSRKQGSRDLSSTEEFALKKNAKINERQVQDVLLSAEIEKRPDKHRRRNENKDREKWLEDSRDFDDRRLSSRDHSRNKSYKDERHDNPKYKGKYRIDNDRDQNHHDEKNQDEWSSKDCISDKSHKFRDENKLQDIHKKTKPHDTDQDGSYVDVVDTKLKDSRRRRYSNEKDDICDLKLRGTKERYEVEKTASSAYRTSSHNGIPRSTYCHTEKANSSPKNRQFKNFTSSSAHADNDQNRDTLRHEESVHRVSEHEERRCSAVSKGDGMTSSGFRDRDAAPRSGKLTMKDDIHSGRSPSKFERPRKTLDAEMVQRSAKYKDRGRGNDVSQAAASARESTPISSSIYKSGYIPDCSPNHMHPPPPTRVGTDSPSVLGPYQDDNRANSSERRSYNRYDKQTSDLGIGKEHGNTRKGAPNWPSPATNGFLPLQHGPPPTGFHPALPQFPPPLLFGVRPMDLVHSSISYHMHEMAERFSGVSQPFGWHNSLDQLCQPPMQMWDRTNGLLGNETPSYGRQEWDGNGQLLGSRGWEMGSEMWKDQNIKNMETPALKKEHGSSTHSLTDEVVVQSKFLPTESIDEKQSNETATSKNEMESPQILVSEKTSKPSFVSDDKKANYAAIYLSRIDISSDLAGLEMYKRCSSQMGILDIKDVGSLTSHGCFQMNKDGNIEKMKSSILKSFFPSAKDDIFKKAMSMYQKQSGRLCVNHAVLQTYGSEETEPQKASKNEAARSGNDLTSLEKVTAISADDDSANNMLVDNAILSAEDSNLAIPGAVDHYNNGPATIETALAGEDTASVSRIPNFHENTH